jgi:hypothetical protein
MKSRVFLGLDVKKMFTLRRSSGAVKSHPSQFKSRQGVQKISREYAMLLLKIALCNMQAFLRI